MEVSVRLVGSAAFKAVGTSDPRPAGSIPVHLRHLLARIAIAVIAFLALMPMGQLHADAARPGNMESIVESVSPATDAARFDIVGGDAFIRLRVAGGHEVAVSGYQHEPYLRIDTDGSVWVNTWSPTVALSTSRYGPAADPPASTTENSEPTWARVGSDGTYLWHDHRVHWMSPSTPPTINDEGLVQQWSVPFTVDGRVVTVAGSIYLRSSPGSWWWLLVVPCAVIGWMVRRRMQRSLIALASVVVTVIGAMARWGLPSLVRPTPTLFALGLAGLIIVNVAEIMRRQTEIVDALIASSGIALMVAVFVSRDMVSHRFVPGVGDMWWVRMSLPAIAGVSVGAVVASIRNLLKKN